MLCARAIKNLHSKLPALLRKSTYPIPLPIFHIDYRRFREVLKWWRVTPPTLLFFVHNCFQLLIPLPVHINFRISLSASIKHPAEISTGSTLNPWINVGEKDVFTLLSLPIHTGAMPHHCSGLFPH